MVRALWLADVLREAGLKVVEEDGWEDRGREMYPIEGVLCHHTAGEGPSHGDDPSLGIIINGRSDLRGPLAQLLLARDGTYHVVASGRCNHAGRGKWHHIVNGNEHLIGIEAENTGYVKGPRAEKWPEIQMQAYARGVAAILTKIEAPVSMCAGHKEYALPKGRKTDPTFDMNKFRERVKAIMNNEEDPLVLTEAPPNGRPDQVEVVPPEVTILPLPVQEVVLTPPEQPVQMIIKDPPLAAPMNPNHLHGHARPLYVKKVLEELGWKDYQAAAMVGGFMVESYSNLISDVWGDKDTAYPSFGIGQWRRGRLYNLEKFAKTHYKPISDLDLQARFVDWELRNTEWERAGKALKNSKNMLEALRAAIGYERPGGWTHHHPENGNGWLQRMHHAHSLMNMKK